MERKLAATNFCCYVYELTQVNVTHNRRKCEYITIKQQKYLDSGLQIKSKLQYFSQTSFIMRCDSHPCII